MAIFHLNYNKEGPGVGKDEPEKNIFITGFTLYKRNFWNFMKIDLIYTLSSIPMLAILLYLFIIFFYPHLSTLIAMLAQGTPVDEEAARATFFGIFSGIFAAELFFLIGAGPSSEYFAYAVKCMTRDEHLWVWSDFKSKFSENFKQAIAVCITDIVLMTLFLIALPFYYSYYKATGNVIFMILEIILLAFIGIYLLMHGYIYQMLVTFENKLTILYKNAFLLAVAKLPQNILLLGVPMVLTYFLFTYFTPVFAWLIYIVIWIGAMRFPMEFYAARTLGKVIDERNREEGRSVGNGS